MLLWCAFTRAGFFYDNATVGVLKYVEFTCMPVCDIWLSCSVCLVTSEASCLSEIVYVWLIWNRLHCGLMTQHFLHFSPLLVIAWMKPSMPKNHTLFCSVPSRIVCFLNCLCVFVIMQVFSVLKVDINIFFCEACSHWQLLEDWKYFHIYVRFE